MMDDNNNGSMWGDYKSKSCTRRRCPTYYNKRKRKGKHMSTIHVDFDKSKSNPNLCTNPVGMPVLGRVMLYPL